MEVVTQEHIDLADAVVSSFVTRQNLYAVDRDALRGAALESLARSAIRYDPSLTDKTFVVFAALRMWYALIDELRVLDRGGRERPRRTAAAAAAGRTLAEPIRTVSLEATLAGTDGVRVGDALVGGEDPVDVVVARDRFLEMLSAILDLPERQREVLIRTLEGDTGDQIAGEFGVTEGRISQIRRDALDRIQYVRYS